MIYIIKEVMYMNIIFRAGNPKDLPVFLCDSCGCEFATDEFTTDAAVNADCYVTLAVTTRTSTCPCCGMEVENTTVERG